MNKLLLSLACCVIAVGTTAVAEEGANMDKKLERDVEQTLRDMNKNTKKDDDDADDGLTLEERLQRDVEEMMQGTNAGDADITIEGSLERFLEGKTHGGKLSPLLDTLINSEDPEEALGEITEELLRDDLESGKVGELIEQLEEEEDGKLTEPLSPEERGVIDSLLCAVGDGVRGTLLGLMGEGDNLECGEDEDEAAAAANAPSNAPREGEKKPKPEADKKEADDGESVLGGMGYEAFKLCAKKYTDHKGDQAKSVRTVAAMRRNFYRSLVVARNAIESCLPILSVGHPQRPALLSRLDTLAQQIKEAKESCEKAKVVCDA